MIQMSRARVVWCTYSLLTHSWVCCHVFTRGLSRGIWPSPHTASRPSPCLQPSLPTHPCTPHVNHQHYKAVTAIMAWCHAGPRMWTLGNWHPTRSCPTDWPHPDWRHWQSPESCLYNSCPTRRNTTWELLWVKRLCNIFRLKAGFRGLRDILRAVLKLIFKCFHKKFKDFLW